jgi:ABC-type transport system involved in multi-copper enzyme maturation permease subunit
MAEATTGMALVGAWQAWVGPLWIVAAAGAGAAVVLIVAYLLLAVVTPKIAAIARTTALQGWNHPLFWVLFCIGLAWLVVSVFLPYFTLGEDLKVYKEGGLEFILVLATLLSVWTASVSISSELEGRTALTLLSKPVSRRDFVIGKFLGVQAPVYTMCVVLGMIFLTCLSGKVVYDARESSQLEPVMGDCRLEILQAMPALALAFLATMVMGSIAVALSTRLAMVPNLLVCISIFALGKLTPQLVQSSEVQEQVPFVAFVGRLIATVIPVQEHFNVEAAIATGRTIPVVYLGTSLAYAAVYSTLALLLALLLFEDRDLA